MAAAWPSSSWSGGQLAGRLVKARQDGLVGPHGLARAGHRGQQAGAQDRLAHARVGARDEEASHGRGSSGAAEATRGPRPRRRSACRSPHGARSRPLGPPRRASSRPGEALPRSWPALTVKRSREVPGGTEGGRIPWAKRPRSRAAWERRMARSSVPRINGMMCMSSIRTAKPSAARPSRSARARAPSLLASRGSCSMIVERRQSARRGRRGRGRREDQRAGRVDEVVDGLGAGAARSPVGAERLPERPHEHIDLVRKAGCRDGAAAARAERADRVGLVDDRRAPHARGPGRRSPAEEPDRRPSRRPTRSRSRAGRRPPRAAAAAGAPGRGDGKRTRAPATGGSASMIEAWLSRSEKIRSPGPARAARTPTFAR